MWKTCCFVGNTLSTISDLIKPGMMEPKLAWKWPQKHVQLRNGMVLERLAEYLTHWGVWPRHHAMAHPPSEHHRQLCDVLDEAGEPTEAPMDTGGDPQTSKDLYGAMTFNCPRQPPRRSCLTLGASSRVNESPRTVAHP